MSSVSLIILLLVATLSPAISSPDIEKYFKLLTELEDHPAAAKGTKLLWDIVKDIGSYHCTVDVGSKECKAFEEYLEEKTLSEKINCDETPENEDCLKARKLLGSEKSLSDQELKEALVADADAKIKATHENFLWLDTVRGLLIDIICFSEPEQCKFWKLVYLVTF